MRLTSTSLPSIIFFIERIQTRFKGDCDPLKGNTEGCTLYFERIQTRFKGDCDTVQSICWNCSVSERIQTRFKGDCDHNFRNAKPLYYFPREFRPDLKGIATTIHCLTYILLYLREFRPDLKGIATYCFRIVASVSSAERIQTRFKGDCDVYLFYTIPYHITSREFRPDLKGIATFFSPLFTHSIIALREFRPDLKGIATFVSQIHPQPLSLRENSDPI